MKKLARSTLVALVSVATWGCGDTEPAGDAAGSTDAGSTGAPGAGSAAQPAASVQLVDRAVIESCAGFNADKAAEMLDMNATALEVTETYSERVGGQICRYWNPESNIGPGIDILLNDHESVAAAERIIESQRELVPRVDEIPPTGPALVEYDFGDDAFWDTNTGGVVVRVRNVVVQVHASPSRELTSDRDPTQIALERRVAEEVAVALQES